jgi:hypothetical protein
MSQGLKIIIGLIVAAAVVVFIVRGGNEANDMENPTNNQNSSQEETIDEDTELKDLVQSGGSYQCTVRQVIADVESDGEVYISGPRISAVYETQIAGAGSPVFTTNMISDGEYVYTWSSQSLGFKTKVVETDETDNIPTEGQVMFDFENVLDYDCQSWDPIESYFEIPTEVDFQEV